MKPEDFFSEVSFAGGHSQVVRDVYTGAVDIGSSFDDARSTVSDLPNVFGVVSVLTYTKYIPNDVWVYRPGLNSNLVQTMTAGIMNVADTSAGGDALKTLINSAHSGVSDMDVEEELETFRQMKEAFGIETAVCHFVNIPVILKSHAK